MTSAEPLLILTTASLIGLALLAAVFAWSWKAWLDLRRHALDHGSRGGEMPAVANRIDLADLKERIRKLEAIAAGVEF